MLRAEVYAVAALAGAIVVVSGSALGAAVRRGYDCRRAPLLWASLHGHPAWLAPARRWQGQSICREEMIQSMPICLRNSTWS